MWPFIMIMAIVPMIFFWSDSVRDMFPALQKFLPEKSSPTHLPGQQPAAANLPPELAKSAESGHWYVSNTKKGYVAWVMSADGQYRLAVGCRPEAQGSLEVTSMSGATMPEGLHLNYQFGDLRLNKGYYAGDELINAVAQFKNVYLQTSANEVKAQFTAAGADSNGVARDVQNTCVAAQSTDSQ
jgi:hypothetical protein